MSTTNFTSVKRYADLTLELLAKHDISPTPINYSVFFLYSNGGTPELNQKINLQIKQKKVLDNVFIENLFSDYLSNSEQIKNTVLSPLNVSISTLLNNLNEQVNFVQETADNLKKINKALVNTSQPNSLNKIVTYLLTTVNHSSLQHQNLLEQLSKTDAEVNQLKTKLEAFKKEAELDALTGLLNRRGCEERLEQFDLEDTHTSLMIDIDHFKKINDNFGHFIGDKILQRVAKTIQANISELDLAVRYGGEEFVVVMIKKPIAEAKIIAEKIRLAIMALKLKQRNADNYLPQISISVGIAENKPKESWLDLFKRADDALYKAKSSGRNCLMVAE